jgi:hypothetical protein
MSEQPPNEPPPRRLQPKMPREQIAMLKANRPANPMLNYTMDVNPYDGPRWLSENLVKVLVVMAVLVVVMAVFVIAQAEPQR